VLSLPENNALNPYLLPATTSTYPGGIVTWSETLNQSAATWTITSTWFKANPTGPANDVRRTVTATVLVTPSFAYPANSPVWNYIYAKRTGDPDRCDLEIRNSSDVAAPVYAEGNLCIGQTTKLVRGPVVTKGKLTLENPQNSVGKSTQYISDARIANGCQYKNNPYHNPCQGTPDNLFATVLDTSPPPVTPPMVDWDAVYLNASPGPYYALCQRVRGAAGLRQRPGVAGEPQPGPAERQPAGGRRPDAAGLVHVLDARRGALLERNGEGPDRSRHDLHRRQREELEALRRRQRVELRRGELEAGRRVHANAPGRLAPQTIVAQAQAGISAPA